MFQFSQHGAHFVVFHLQVYQAGREVHLGCNLLIVVRLRLWRRWLGSEQAATVLSGHGYWWGNFCLFGLTQGQRIAVRRAAIGDYQNI